MTGRTLVQRMLCLAALTALLWAGGVAPASGQTLGVLRVESLDAVLADVETVARIAGAPFHRNQILGPLMGVFGIRDASMVDPKRPLVVTLPVDGMMMAQKGAVAAFPVTEPGKAVEALASGFTSHRVEGDLHVFTKNGAPALFSVTRQGYLVVGATRDFVRQFDAQKALAAWDGPAGSLGLEVFIEPVAPLIRMTLTGAKEQMKAQLQEQQASGDLAGTPLDAANLGGVVDLPLELLLGLVNEVSRIQVALQLEAGHAFFHKRLVPKAGGAFAELVAAQTGGLPAIGRLADPGAPIVVAGNIEMTTATRNLLKSVANEYLSWLQPLLQSIQLADSGDGAKTTSQSAWDLDLAAYGNLIDRSVDCMRGDFVETFSFDAKRGLSFVQVFGQNADEACRTFIQDYLTQIESDLAQNADLGRFFTFAEGPVVGGLPTHTLTVNPVDLIEATGQSDREAEEVLNALYGGKEMTVRLATGEELLLSVAGKDGEAQLQRLIKAVASEGGQGITAETFHPLPAGPGVFQRVDVGLLLEGFLAAAPATDQEREELLAVTKALSGPAGRIPAGLRFGPSGVTFHLAVPLKAIETVVALAGASQRSEVGPPKQ